jgi:electron transfer flavoprotein alpha subunit
MFLSLQIMTMVNWPGATLNTVTAASQIGGDIHVLVAGDASGDVARAAAAVAGVAKVLVANGDSLCHGIAENVAPLIQEIGVWLFASSRTGDNNR